MAKWTSLNLAILGGVSAQAAVFPCDEDGVRAATATGGGPHTFKCNKKTTVVTSDRIIPDRTVVGGEAR